MRSSHGKQSLFSWLLIGSLSLGLGSVFVGCGDDDDDDGRNRGGTSGRGGGAGTAGQGGTAGQAGTGGGGQGGAAGDAGDAAVTVNDNQIAGIMQAANAGEIAQAEAAIDAGVTGPILTYANAMITGHTAALGALNALLGDGGAGDGGDGGTLSPQPSDQRAALEATTAQIIASLQPDAGSGDGGSDVNEIYISSQVDVHGTLLTMLDSVLIPQADHAGLRAYLQDVRGDVQTHLNQARALDGEGDGGADAATD